MVTDPDEFFVYTAAGPDFKDNFLIDFLESMNDADGVAFSRTSFFNEGVRKLSDNALVMEAQTVRETRSSWYPEAASWTKASPSPSLPCAS